MSVQRGFAVGATFLTRVGATGEKRYSPAKCIGVECKIVSGDPDAKHIFTSDVERQNLTTRMSMRHFTRLTNAFSKKVENHAAAVALYFMHYNFGRVHQTIRVTPAMEARISDHVWSIEEIVGLLARKTKRRSEHLSNLLRGAAIVLNVVAAAWWIWTSIQVTSRIGGAAIVSSGALLWLFFMIAPIIAIAALLWASKDLN